MCGRVVGGGRVAVQVMLRRRRCCCRHALTPLLPSLPRSVHCRSALLFPPPAALSTAVFDVTLGAQRKSRFLLRVVPLPSRTAILHCSYAHRARAAAAASGAAAAAADGSAEAAEAAVAAAWAAMRGRALWRDPHAWRAQRAAAGDSARGDTRASVRGSGSGSEALSEGVRGADGDMVSVAGSGSGSGSMRSFLSPTAPPSSRVAADPLPPAATADTPVAAATAATAAVDASAAAHGAAAAADATVPPAAAAAADALLPRALPASILSATEQQLRRMTWAQLCSERLGALVLPMDGAAGVSKGVRLRLRRRCAPPRRSCARRRACQRLRCGRRRALCSPSAAVCHRDARCGPAASPAGAAPEQAAGAAGGGGGGRCGHGGHAGAAAAARGCVCASRGSARARLTPRGGRLRDGHSPLQSLRHARCTARGKAAAGLYPRCCCQLSPLSPLLPNVAAPLPAAARSCRRPGCPPLLRRALHPPPLALSRDRAADTLPASQVAALRAALLAAATSGVAVVALPAGMWDGSTEAVGARVDMPRRMEAVARCIKVSTHVYLRGVRSPPPLFPACRAC